MIVKKTKKRTCRIVDFAVPADHRVKLKESEQRDKYLDLAKVLKKLSNEGDGDTSCSRCTWTIPKILVKGLEDLEIRGKVETIQTTALLRPARILRIGRETCCHSNFSEKPSANAVVKNSQKSKTIRSRKFRFFFFHKTFHLFYHWYEKWCRTTAGVGNNFRLQATLEFLENLAGHTELILTKFINSSF